MPNGIDYKIECLAFLRLKKGGDPITIQSFCVRRSAELGKPLSFHYFKKQLGKLKHRGARGAKAGNARAKKAAPPKVTPPKDTPTDTSMDTSTPDWPAIKEAYLGWKFASLAEVARHVGMQCSTRVFRAATAGWKATRDAAERPSMVASVDQLAKERGAQRVRDIYAEALVIHYRMLDILDKTSECRSKWNAPDASPWHSQMAVTMVIDMTRALERILPAIRGLESLGCVHEIFDRVIDGTKDVTTAALELAKLGIAMPKPIEIMLSKQKVEETPPPVGDEITTEAIMKRRLEILAEIDTERVEFVRERKRLVAELKTENRGSFEVERDGA